MIGATREGGGSVVKVCSFPECGRPFMAKAVCAGHYTQQYKGLPLTPLRARRAPRQEPRTASQIVTVRDGIVLKQCVACKGRLRLSNFHIEANGLEGRRAICKTCAKSNRAEWYAERRARVNAVKLASGCVDCGYRDHPEALDFDHRPGTTKRSTIGQGVSPTWRWDVIEAEMAKCDIRCANCHRIMTATRRLEAA
jgi:hypothetical protein